MTREQQLKARRERAYFIKAMLEAGWREWEAAWVLGISKQRVCQLLARELPDLDLRAIGERQQQRIAFDPSSQECCLCAVCRHPFVRAKTLRPRQTCSPGCSQTYYNGTGIYQYVGKGNGKYGKHRDWSRRAAVVLE